MKKIHLLVVEVTVSGMVAIASIAYQEPSQMVNAHIINYRNDSAGEELPEEEFSSTTGETKGKRILLNIPCKIKTAGW